jgi:CRISPR system Cascade subunit CasE
MRLFGDMGPGEPPRLQSGVLFRLEPEIGPGRVLVQSADPTADDTLRSVDLGFVLSKLSVGQRVGLRLKVNAVKTANRTVGDVVRKTRIVIEPDELADWVASRLGSALINLSISEITTNIEKQRSTPLAVATIDASATVVGTAELARLVGSGVGKAKAFGCGLLTLRPVSTR